MYCIIEYSDDKKNNTIEIHGYTNTLDHAKNVGISLANEYCIKHGYQSVYNLRISNYNFVKLFSTIRGNVIEEYMCASLEDISDTEIINIINNAREKNQTIEMFITSCIGDIKKIPDQYNDVKSIFLYDISMDDIRNILNTLAFLYYENREFGPIIIERATNIFSIVECLLL